MARLALLFFCALPVLAQGTLTQLTVQPAEWQNMPTPVPAGTRTDAPVTFGVGIPDSAGVDCPGAQSSPGSEEAPTKLELYSGGAQVASQFRCLGHWPSGHAEWVLVDAQLPSFSEATGYDTSLTLVQVAAGGGNYPATTLAVQCTGEGTPSSGCPDGNHILVDTGAATFLIKEAEYNLFDDVQVGSAHLVSSSNHGANDGLILTGPSHAHVNSGTIDAVSCNPGPLPTYYTGETTCSTIYSSNLDSASSCKIEENGPLKAVVMCQGSLVNPSGDVYTKWRTRTYFWANHSDVKLTVAHRNADVPNPCCKTANFTNAAKEFNQFEARLTDNLGSPSSRNWQMAGSSGTVSGKISAANGSDNVELFQAYSTNGEWPHWSSASNCAPDGGGGDGCVVSFIPRSGAPGNWTYAASGWQIDKNGSIVTSGAKTTYPVGWADLDDGSNGIETGVYELSMYWPKTLEYWPGTLKHNEIRIGIWPNQSEWLGGTTRHYDDATTGDGGGPFPVSYTEEYGSYQIHDLYFNFHSGTQTATAAQNQYLYFQHYMLARPSSGTYYNSVKDSTYGFDALNWDIPDPVAEDEYYISLGVCSTTAGQCLPDVGEASFPYGAHGGAYAGMKIFRFVTYQAPGGDDGTQYEQRFSYLRNWLQRGGAANVGSVPGRYIWASHFYRLVTEKTIPRADTVTNGAGAGFRQFLTSMPAATGSQFAAWGDPRENSSTVFWNTGMRNWGDDANAQEHNVFWGAFTYYFLSGDEFVREQLLDGFKDRDEAPFLSFTNVYGNSSSSGNNAPGHGHVNAIRAVGHWLSTVAAHVDFLCAISDPDCDTRTSMAASPATSPSTATPMQGALQVVAAQIMQPFISAGYPAGWRDGQQETGVNCSGKAVEGFANLCSQGISPVRYFMRGGNGSESCGTSSGKAPCNSQNQRSDDSFQTSVYAEGIYRFWQESTKILGRNYHLCVSGGASGGIVNGGTALTNTYLVPAMKANTTGCSTVSERGLLDRLYGVWQEVAEANGVQVTNYTGTGGSHPPYGLTGMTYMQFSDYLNSKARCTSNTDCKRVCPDSDSGCAPLTSWMSIAAAAPSTNTTNDLAGTHWQFLFEAVMSRNGDLGMELSSHMMEFGLNYILADGGTNPGYAVNAGVPQLAFVNATVKGCTGAGCTYGASYCIGPTSGMGTCTIAWTPPSALKTVNGVSYRLKYYPCQSGVLTIYGNDCPSVGKTIVASLNFHDDITTAGAIAVDGQSEIDEGSWEISPALHWNWFATENVPDCLPKQSPPSCNSAVPSGSSYTFNTQAGTTYTFSLAAYQ